MKKTANLLLLLFGISMICQSQDFELVPYRKKNKWGFADSLKNIIIKPAYENVTPFNKGYAAFQKDGKWGFIDNKGNTVMAPTYDSVQNYFHLLPVWENDDLGNKLGIEVYMNGKMQFVDIEGGKLEHAFANVEEEVPIDDRTYQYPYMTFNENNLYGIKDAKSKVVLVKAKYEALRIPQYTKDLIFYKLEGKWGCLNERFEEYIDNIYDSIEYVFRDMMIVGVNNKFGAINKKNMVIVPTIWHSVIRNARGNNGFYVINDEGKMGFVNNKGEMVFEPMYKKIVQHREEAISFWENGMWGYKDDIKGTHIKPKYQSVEQFRNGYSIVTDSKGRKGYINTKGVEFF